MTEPDPITTADLWDLKTDPVRLDTLAGTWRSLGAKVGSAEGLINDAAHAVFSKESWTGDTAASFNDYRKRLTADVERFGRWATNVADLLSYTATVLRVQQGLLDDERKKLSAVPTTTGLDSLTFRPRDTGQASLVTGAISTAQEIRGRVDEVLAEKKRDMKFYEDQFELMAKEWKPRTIRLLNLNIGQGAGNSPGDSKGTDSGDIPRIAQVIADQDADVATIQEVFRHNTFDLEEELEKRTGDNWEVRFEEASKKYHASDDWPIIGDVINAPFGNAVLVREGDVIEGAGDNEKVKLDVDGGSITVPANEPGAGDRRIDDGEGRSAAETEVRIRPR
ncbi:endonuclease/exonuclease/phosphatase family protein [Streptosporangium pseudovulgare]|uniref:Uncharacterized protein n=1 Tax=Streptosporangium pseudovulgare TaxID=35765 RepID=A0ABQ2R7C7_9ACTN|nr:hypothetical protein [Streptosporangium pseudovulgare]GGQ17605.1 hypothetical protein GCM10010140_54840 [Streptosporangium pseudovulgare]